VVVAAGRRRHLGGGVAKREPAWVPRSFLENPADFGSVASPPHRSPADITEAGQLAASLAQHSAALVIKAHRDAGLTVRDLAERIGGSEDYLSGLLTGRYPAGYDDLARWAIAVRDISVLPVVDELEPFTPPALSR
jgi:hypothetical protein